MTTRPWIPAIVDRLLADMSGRRGFKLDQVDEETRVAWRERWAKILDYEIPATVEASGPEPVDPPHEDLPSQVNPEAEE